MLVFALSSNIFANDTAACQDRGQEIFISYLHVKPVLIRQTKSKSSTVYAWRLFSGYEQLVIEYIVLSCYYIFTYKEYRYFNLEYQTNIMQKSACYCHYLFCSVKCYKSCIKWYNSNRLVLGRSAEAQWTAFHQRVYIGDLRQSSI